MPNSARRWRIRLDCFDSWIIVAAISSAVSDLRGVRAERFIPEIANQVPHLRVSWDPATLPLLNEAVAKRLRQFLEVSATVDFGATLVPCKGSAAHLSCFANPTYEAQSADWKRCYRAGQQPVQAARTFAAAWLRELEPE